MSSQTRLVAQGVLLLGKVDAERYGDGEFILRARSTDGETRFSAEINRYPEDDETQGESLCLSVKMDQRELIAFANMLLAIAGTKSETQRDAERDATVKTEEIHTCSRT